MQLTDPDVTDSCSEAMAAALMLTGFASQPLAAATPPATLPTTPPTSPPADQLVHLPNATTSWPFAEGKGCFSKSLEGKDVPFLERIFMLLSLPNLAIPSHPGRRLGEAICWKSGAALEALGLPASMAAFEIRDVTLFEAAVYPQYASGSFNKTAGKWGLITPAPQGQLFSKRLNRDCLLLPPAPGALPSDTPLRALPPTADLAAVFRHVQHVIRPIVSASRAGRSLQAESDATLAAYALTRGAGAAVDAATPALATSSAVPAFSTPTSPPRVSSDAAPSTGTAGSTPPPFHTAPPAAVTRADTLSDDTVSRVVALAAANATAPEAAHGPAPSTLTISDFESIIALSKAASQRVPGPAPSHAAPTLAPIPVPPSGVNAAKAATATDTKPAAGRGAKRAAPGVRGAKWSSLQVVLWDRQKRQRIASTAYKGDLHAVLMANPHLEVYNRQDVTEGRGASLLAGQRLTMGAAPAGGEMKVVLWDAKALQKLPLEDSPTQAGLCAFLKAHPTIEIYQGQESVHVPRIQCQPPSAGVAENVGVQSDTTAKVWSWAVTEGSCQAPGGAATGGAAKAALHSYNGNGVPKKQPAKMVTQKPAFSLANVKPLCHTYPTPPVTQSAGMKRPLELGVLTPLVLQPEATARCI